MCNRLPEINKNGDAGIFPVYYSLNVRLFFMGDRNDSKKLKNEIRLAKFL